MHASHYHVTVCDVNMHSLTQTTHVYLHHVATSLMTPKTLIILMVNDPANELINHVKYLDRRRVIFTSTSRTHGLTESSTSCVKKVSELVEYNEQDKTMMILNMHTCFWTSVSHQPEPGLAHRYLHHFYKIAAQQQKQDRPPISQPTGTLHHQ